MQEMQRVQIKAHIHQLGRTNAEDTTDLSSWIVHDFMIPRRQLSLRGIMTKILLEIVAGFQFETKSLSWKRTEKIFYWVLKYNVGRRLASLKLISFNSCVKP